MSEQAHSDEARLDRNAINHLRSMTMAPADYRRVTAMLDRLLAERRSALNVPRRRRFPFRGAASCTTSPEADRAEGGA